MMGMQNMMAMGRGQTFKKIQINYCVNYLLCSMSQRRYQLNDFDEMGLKTLNLFMEYTLRQVLTDGNHVAGPLPSTNECHSRVADYKAMCLNGETLQ